jgi:DNA-binding response OmpR family regulator
MNDAIPVLVVEDEPAVQSFIEEVLSDGGFEADFAESGEEGVSRFRKADRRYRALLTDINIGRGITGWDVARQVREIDPDLPIVYMTGTSAEEWKSRGVPNSILLEKPFAPAQLLTAVSQLLNTGTTSL